MKGLVGGILAQANLGTRPRGDRARVLQDLKTQDLNAVSYLVPSILGMSLMQLGIFSALPLVADRQKLILKRLSATPLRRWQLIGSNIIMRLLVGLAQTTIIVGIGALVFDVKITGSLVAVAGLALLGAVTFISLGYVVASFAKTEDSANGMVSAIQFPLMFLSGTFFPIDVMPDALQGVARFLPADLPLRRDAPGDGQRGGLRAARRVRGGAGRLGRGVLRDLGALLQVAVTAARGRPPGRYQRSSWTISASGRRPPGCGGAVRLPGSAG